MTQFGAPDPGELEQFRTRCRAFLVEHAVGGGDIGPDDPRGDRALAVARVFQRALFDAGLAGITVAPEHGGQGLSAVHERVWREEAGRFPMMTEQLSISLGNCFPVLAEFGTTHQKACHLRRILRADEVFCQLFSEPSAGSDLAAVQTRATPTGSGWVLNGQKVWTTLAHKADFGVLLARTDPTRARHHGLSMFVLDMRSPGVEIRPIHQMDGALHFDEVFFTDVEIPADALLPPENDGWRIASTMLGYQRVARGTGQTGGVQHPRADRLIDEARRRNVARCAALRSDLMRLYSEEVCNSVLASRTRAALEAGRPPGPVGSLSKLAGARIAGHFGELIWRVVGPDAVAWSATDGGAWAKDALYTRSMSISGGTSEVQRNIIGERILGLPREPSPT